VCQRYTLDLGRPCRYYPVIVVAGDRVATEFADDHRRVPRSKLTPTPGVDKAVKKELSHYLTRLDLFMYCNIAIHPVQGSVI
jgi:hypothetical protein